MAGLNDTIRTAFPGGIGKPLMLALGALLASGVLTRGSAGQTAGGAGVASPAQIDYRQDRLVGGISSMVCGRPMALLTSFIDLRVEPA